MLNDQHFSIYLFICMRKATLKLCQDINVRIAAAIIKILSLPDTGTGINPNPNSFVRGLGRYSIDWSRSSNFGVFCCVVSCCLTMLFASKATRLYDPCSYWRNFCNCIEKPEKFRTSKGFERAALQYWCDALTNWAVKPLTLGTGHLWVLTVFPWGMNQWTKW